MKQLQRLRLKYVKWPPQTLPDRQTHSLQKQKQILDGMDERISDIKETTNRIEGPSEPVRKAITAGTGATQKAAQEALEQKSKQSSFNRFGKSPKILNQNAL